MSVIKQFRYVNQNGESITFDIPNGYVIQKPSGVDTLIVSLSEAQGINQVGSTVQSVNVESRPVTITGILIGEDQNAQKERLLAVVRPDLSGKLYADNYYLDVYPTSTPAIESKKLYAAFQFSVKAPYPYWQKDNSISRALSGIQKLFKFPWNLTKSWQFGQAMATQFINVKNTGQVPVPFTLTITAKDTVTNPAIRNVTTGQLLTINKGMVQSEVIVAKITHSRIYVSSTVDGDIRGALSLGSTFTRLAVGDNVLKPEAEAGLANLEITIDFATEITGVVL